MIVAIVVVFVVVVVVSTPTVNICMQSVWQHQSKHAQANLHTMLTNEIMSNRKTRVNEIKRRKKETRI